MTTGRRIYSGVLKWMGMVNLLAAMEIIKRAVGFMMRFDLCQANAKQVHTESSLETECKFVCC